MKFVDKLIARFLGVVCILAVVLIMILSNQMNFSIPPLTTIFLVVSATIFLTLE